MANTVQIKRGSNASVNAHTGPSGEIIYNLDTGRLHAQDGSTAGGNPHALISDVDLKANAATQVIAGDGLTGGGTLAASRTLALNSTSIASLAKADTAVQPAIAITAGTGLTGGGTLAASRTVALNAASIASLAKADTALQAPGGSAGQILAKNSATTNDVLWVSSEAATAVSYGPQTLTAAQQVQARQNIQADHSYDTIAIATAATVPSYANAIRTNGYYAAGDGGSALYKRVPSEPSHAGKFQSADGAWWEIAESRLNPIQFGAIGGGISDDSQSFKDCVATRKAFGPGIIHIPNGQWHVNDVEIDFGGVWLEGDGALGSWIRNNSSDKPSFNFTAPSGYNTRSKISNVLFSQDDSVLAIKGNCALNVKNQSDIVIENVQIFGSPASNFNGIQIDGCVNVFLSEIGIQSCRNTGVVIFDTFDIYGVNVRSHSSQYGFEIESSLAAYALNWHAYGNSVHGFVFRENSSSIRKNANHFFVNCVGDTSGSHNWYFEQLWNSRFVNCWGSTQQSQSVGGNSDGFHLNGVAGAINDVSFSSCIAYCNNQHGIFLGNVEDIVIDGCKLGVNYDPTMFGGLGGRNGMSGSGSGIFISGLSKKVNITGGRATHNATAGIVIQPGAQDISISSIPVDGNLTYSILNSSLSTSVNIANCRGYNPIKTNISPPPVPASEVSAVNNLGVGFNVYLVGGTYSEIYVDSVYLGGASLKNFYLPSGSSVSIKYSSAPSWVWFGD